MREKVVIKPNFFLLLDEEYFLEIPVAYITTTKIFWLVLLSVFPINKTHFDLNKYL